MGRTPEGEQALTGAERQARYRERLGLAHHIVASGVSVRLSVLPG